MFFNVIDPSPEIAKKAAGKILSGGGSVKDVNKMMLLSIAQESQDIQPLLRGIQTAMEQYNQMLTAKSSMLDKYKTETVPIFKEAGKLVSQQIPQPPTYEDITTPKTDIEKIFKQVVPSIVTAFAFLNPGRYGENFYMINSMYDAIKTNDKEQYERALKEWQIKTETSLKNRELQLKALDYKLKSKDLAFKTELEKLGINVEALKTNIQTQLETIKSVRENFKVVRDTLANIAKNMLEEKKIAVEASKAKEQDKITRDLYKYNLARLTSIEKLLADPTIPEAEKIKLTSEYRITRDIVKQLEGQLGIQQRLFEQLPATEKPTTGIAPEERIEVLSYDKEQNVAIIRDKQTNKIKSVSVGKDNTIVYDETLYRLKPKQPKQ